MSNTLDMSGREAAVDMIEVHTRTRLRERSGLVRERWEGRELLEMDGERVREREGERGVYRGLSAAIEITLFCSKWRKDLRTLKIQILPNWKLSSVASQDLSWQL